MESSVGIGKGIEVNANDDLLRIHLANRTVPKLLDVAFANLIFVFLAMLAVNFEDSKGEVEVPSRTKLAKFDLMRKLCPKFYFLCPFLSDHR